MALWKYFYSAKDLDEALEVLSGTVDNARLIAGGTDLLIDLQQGRQLPVHTLVDISNIAELGCLDIRGNRIFIGAAVPLNRIIENTLINKHAQALVEACRLIGGPQVRNVATLGGNVAHALPGADGTIALMSLDAQAEVKDVSGIHEVPLVNLFLGPGRSALDPRNEILTGFYISCKEQGETSRFDRVMRPQGVALPILNIAVWVKRDGDKFKDVRIAIGPSGPTPKRATAAEKILINEPYSEENIQQALFAMLNQLSFRSSPLRASTDYRRHLSDVLFRNVVKDTFERSVD